MRLISRLFRILPRLKPGFKTKRGIQRTPYISSYFHDLWLPDSGPWPYHPNLYYINALPDTPNLYKRTSATLKETSSPLPSGGWWLRTRQIHYSPQSEGVTDRSTRLLRCKLRVYQRILECQAYRMGKQRPPGLVRCLPRISR